MKIAVTSTGSDLDSEVDPRFGRARFILIVDSETLAFEVVDNKDNLEALKGAGIQAASMISKKGANVLLTGHCGPNAMKALNAAEIGVANNASGSVKDAVKAYLAGELPLTKEADVESQW
ncbi:MAG: NifB/NifX family molybdenum-iron cluster-binding protein [Desulfatiglans sp.]|jgi:predicted Fe-Mo cluster-binding NifX family protein|nr:NifB/NifX family molybdenum-iron cluster-binding protein [Thermodesulfobacteriota bacterium]MEE4353455.1 NifB/NifX family molybdenum-iron cluster-binding protein [Desulfatiglans sp.]